MWAASTKFFQWCSSVPCKYSLGGPVVSQCTLGQPVAFQWHSSGIPVYTGPASVHWLRVRVAILNENSHIWVSDNGIFHWSFVTNIVTRSDINVTQQTLRWRHNERDGVSNHQLHDCLLNCLLRPRSKKISKLRVTGLCAGNSPGTGEFPAQMASNAENASIWWRHHEYTTLKTFLFTAISAPV